MNKTINQKIQSTKTFYQIHKGKLPAISFIAGFLFDIFMLESIDSTSALIQQFAFILLILFLLIIELNNMYNFSEKIKLPENIEQWRIPAIHFLFGSLLSAYTIYYFLSASLATSLEFLLIMVALLLINELPIFQSQGLLVRFTLLNFCIVAYFIYLIPILAGRIGHLVFIASLIMASLIQVNFFFVLWKKFNIEKKFLNKLIASLFTVNALLYSLYILEILPPVPLSIKGIGIYHSVEKSGPDYIAKYERPWWAFWQSGAQTFYARPGDKVHIVAQIHSPTAFQETIYLNWQTQLEDKKWHSSDRIPISISGGKSTGFRGHGYKSNYEPGNWRVKVETSDGREIGRINFVISKKQQIENREFETIVIH